MRLFTVLTYVSALGYCHRLAEYPDPSKAFWVVQILKGYKKIGTRIDSRLPITMPLLRSILRNIATLTSTVYDKRLFQAMCTTAFFAFLRIGEITTCHRSPSVININQVVKVVDATNKTIKIKITLNDFKHSYNERPAVLTLSRRSDICPVQSLLDYFSVRDSSNGPLFQLSSGNPVPRTLFTIFLASVFRACGLDSSKYKGHSFRIGAATFAAEWGFSDEKIRAMGRWRSDAFHKYIRPPSLNVSSL